MTANFCLINLFRIIAIFPIILFFQQTCAQVEEDFSDGNFNVDPEWFGDMSVFKITNSSAIPPEMKPALQLDGLNADTSILYLPNGLIENKMTKLDTRGILEVGLIIKESD